MNRLSSSSKGTCTLLLYIILPSFIKIGQELFEIIDPQTHRQTHKGRHLHADENNASSNTSWGEVIRHILLVGNPFDERKMLSLAR